MTHNGSTCHTVVRMLCSFGLGGVLLSFHSNHSFCLSFLFFLVISFSGRSSRFLLGVYSSAPLSTSWRILSLIPDSRYLEIFFHVFDLLIDIFSLSLMVCIKCSSILPSVCSPNSQSFDFSRSRAAYVKTLSSDLFVLV